MSTIVKPPVHSPNKAPGQAPEPGSHTKSAARSMFDPSIVKPAIVDSFRKLTPRTQLRNPVMFCVYVGSILTTVRLRAAYPATAQVRSESAGSSSTAPKTTNVAAPSSAPTSSSR